MSQAMIDLMVEAGATGKEATMIVDLAKHAAHEAIEAVDRVSKLGPTPLIQRAVFTAALRYLEVNIGEVFDELNRPTKL